MTEITQILTTQSDTLNKMKAKSVLALSDSPSADGVNATMIKNAFVQPLWDGDDSIIGEIGRVCGQINQAFATVKTAIEVNEKSNKENADSITEAKKDFNSAKETLSKSISDNKNATDKTIQDIQENYAKKTDLAQFSYSNGRLKIVKNN